MEYSELVADARRAVVGLRQHRQQLVVDTLQAVDDHRKTHQEWADDIGVSQRVVSYWYAYGHDRQQRLLSDEEPLEYGDWLKEQPGQGPNRASSIAALAQGMAPEQRAEVVKHWLADDDGGRTRAEVGRVLHQHDTDTEQHLADTRQARTSEGQRPDFEATESVQRVLTAYAELVVASDRLPATLADRSKSLIAYAATRALPTVQYHANFEHEYGLTDAELEQWFS